MKKRIGFIFIVTALSSCSVKTENSGLKKTSVPIRGTWQLISGTVIEKGDTTVTDYTKKIGRASCRERV